MTKEEFYEILKLIQIDLKKQRTCFRKPISPAERLAVCLRFLNTGDSFRSIAYSFRLGEATVANIVMQVCQAIWQRLQPTVMPHPTEAMLRESAIRFEQIWNYPNCVAALDGKHVLFQSPQENHSPHFNNKKCSFTVLLAVVGADYLFVDIDVGAYGRNSDAGILENSSIGKRLSNKTFGIPPPKALPSTDVVMPHVILGDEAFCMSAYMMRPYPRNTVKSDHKKEIYNYRHYRARRVVENAFGILSKKYHVFRRPLQINISKGIAVVKACCCLHNFLRHKAMLRNNDTHSAADEEEWLEEFQNSGAWRNLTPTNARATNRAQVVRNDFAEYFVSQTGSLSCQNAQVIL